MRLQMILPRVDAAVISPPEVCPYEGCSSRHFRLHQCVEKRVRDLHVDEVRAHRYACLGCGRTFRVYPTGVDHHATSQRVRGLGVMLYLLGLSYGATSLVLEALDVYQAKSTVYLAVQEAAERVPGLRRGGFLTGIRTPALGADVTSVKCQGKWLQLGLMVDSIQGMVLSIEALPAEDAQALEAWIRPVADLVGADLLVTDDADALKRVADALALSHQVCTNHVRRNTEALVEELRAQLREDGEGSLEAIGVRANQAEADLSQLREWMATRRREQVTDLQEMHLRYAHAPAPRAGERATFAYRMRQLTLDRWELWPRLTTYRVWRGSGGERVDGTNNASERAIGWWLKERYRTMRGYKRVRSALNVSSLLAYCGNALDRGGVDLSDLVA